VQGSNCEGRYVDFASRIQGIWLLFASTRSLKDPGLHGALVLNNTLREPADEEGLDTVQILEKEVARTV
jgi:hypothetical protein